MSLSPEIDLAHEAGSLRRAQWWGEGLAGSDLPRSLHYGCDIGGTLMIQKSGGIHWRALIIFMWG